MCSSDLVFFFKFFRIFALVAHAALVGDLVFFHGFVLLTCNLYCYIYTFSVHIKHILFYIIRDYKLLVLMLIYYMDKFSVPLCSYKNDNLTIFHFPI